MRFPVSTVLAVAGFTAIPLASAAAADGCAPGTFSQSTTPDGNATSILFDDFSATAGGASSTSRSRTTCRIEVPVSQPNGHTVYGVDYRGFAITDDGQTASIRTLQDGRQVLKYQITGPLEDDVEASDRIGVSGTDALALTVVVEAQVPFDPAQMESTLFLDSIDFARLGFTTTASVTASAIQLARQRQSIALDLMDTAQTMLGQSQRFDGDTSLGVFGSSDAAAGFNGRWEAGHGISVLGGAAIVHPNRTDVSIDTLALFAGGLRYTTPDAPWRAFAEAGLWGSPDITARFSRSYLNIDDMVSAGGSASGSLLSTYGRIGAIYSPDDDNELALSARLTRAWLDLDGYRETATGKNLFAATVKGGRSVADTASVELAWSHDAGDKLDFTISGAIGRTYAGKDGVTASVDWVGDVKGTADDQNFATIGGRVGWKFDDRWKIDTSVSGTFRTHDSPDWNVGTQLTASF